VTLSTLKSSSSSLSNFRSVLRPPGSPIEPVAPPIYVTKYWIGIGLLDVGELTSAIALWPRILKCKRARSASRFPTCKEEADGSTPR
jgi:hypothetical protein